MTATTTSAVPAAPVPRGGLRPRGPVWAVWRVHRWALLVWCAYVLLMVGWMLWLHFVDGAQVRAEAAACRMRSGGCIDIGSVFGYSSGLSWAGTFIAYFSYGVAAWAGASLIGRELENGTAQLAWTQSVTPVRWLTAKLAVPAVALTLGTAVLVLVYRWAWSSNRDLLGDEWHYNDPFVNRGPALLAYALCALAVGALAGLALKRSLAALTVAFGFILGFHLYLDDHWPDLWPARTLRGTGDGRYPDDHPASQFWPPHLMTTGVILAVAALATAAAFWLLRRRTR
ncbi:ABC transporter permease [Streptomyces sp. NPDC012510]|uniref:ABC transporter permease n=1 Tax=Streptomyces sp. NPDC012510 TaxID=3364838 RepID=UPI0036E7C501